MKPVVSAARMREIDRLTTQRFGIPSITLMENAAMEVARAATEVLSGSVADRAILVFCGKGNNGGDGAATARLLADAGARVDLILFGRIEDTKGDARANFERLQGLRNAQAALTESELVTRGIVNVFECESEKGWDQLCAGVLSKDHDLVIDAMFGTGPTRPVAGIHLKAVRYMRSLRAERYVAGSKIISIDLPSGLDADLPEPIGKAVQADVTVTFTAPKVANVLPPAATLNGRLVVANIGSPEELIEDDSKLFLTEASDARRWLIKTRYTPESYKNSHGHALIIAGSRGFTGAAALCGNAAMRAGAGLVTVATPLSVQPLVATQVMPEVMTTALAETDRGAVSDEAIDYVKRLAERVQVIAIGPGLSAEDDRTRKFVRSVVEQRETPIVVDADGLNCLAPWPKKLRGSRELPIILTPHPGEMLRLLGTTDKSALADRVTAARQFACAYDLILVLKGSHTIIADPDGRVFINPTGNAGLGTGGAGDTLTGIITGFLAQAYANLGVDANALDATIAALYVSGMAGDLAAKELGMRAMVASDIRDHLSAAICLLDPAGEIP